jgi:hypothetical protein
MAQLVEGYEAWDRFIYGDAKRILTGVCRKAAVALRAHPALRYATLWPTVEAHVARPDRIMKQGVHEMLVEELLANADRRAEEGKYAAAVVPFIVHWN